MAAVSETAVTQSGIEKEEVQPASHACPVDSESLDQLIPVLRRECEDDSALAYERFTKICPQLTAAEVDMCKGFDYEDASLKLPCGPLPWPEGFPTPGYVPKTNLFSGHWVVPNHPGNLYVRINQQGDVFTFDASTTLYVRPKRTFQCGHYYHEPLVSGKNVFVCWSLADDSLLVGFHWTMETGLCNRFERRIFSHGDFTFLRQASSGSDGQISSIFFVKVSDDPESLPESIQNRDYTALAGQKNV
mmetsp:Transcript_104727/g.208076  ORF Transcript_104727/g.208076 Transcript_104727/m.208076 type:complete len:246 (+) Transcript_104727:52-789(+)|eukprot:CAMPEP_0172725336 /NCGR_PEP_ID=MMETSP1074-20121228/88143_1 /TAXON_ID=2916 /ORGANISM="Ceratium fusus, Strain PA161109" /LENGTH=245 /DNA_ID=CAMNT_0013552075 /DNA_START=52 /DNA_END=789 /DNA_ORIENTATION=-